MTGSLTRAPGWRWRIRATVAGETHRLLVLVERLDELGCSAQVTAAGGQWELDLRSALEPTPELLREAVRLIGRAFPGPGISSLVLEVGDRRYQLRPASGARGNAGPAAAEGGS